MLVETTTIANVKQAVPFFGVTNMEASLRFVGPETLETKIFGRLSAWQNWIFYRPNASGPDGALRAYGTGKRADFDRKRV